MLLLAVGCSQPEVEPVALDVEAPPSIRQSTADAPVLVTLDASEVDALNIETYTVIRQDVAHQVTVPGEVVASPEHFSIVSAPISGRIVSIAAHEGEPVRKGSVMLEIESLQFAELVAAHLKARAGLALSEVQTERTRQLVGDQISAQRTLDRLEAEQKQARAELASSLARLQAVGLSRAEIEQWAEEEPASYGILKVHAPISGFIDEHLIDLGQSVQAYDKMLSIVDPGHVMVKGYAPPAEGMDLRTGDAVRVTGRQAGGQQVEARVTSINPSLDADNKSLVVNILMPTINSWPMPGDQVSVDIQHRNATAEMILPLSAIQYEGNRATVFVKQRADAFEKRFVDIGRLDQDYAMVLSGVSEGDEVAVTQVFNLKAISRFEQYGEE